VGHPESQALAFETLDGPGRPGHDNFLLKWAMDGIVLRMPKEQH
jgi:hypothetical protein